MSGLFDFAVTTIFAREMMEASIIIGEYRTIIFQKNEWPDGVNQEKALRAVTLSTIAAIALAVIVVTAVAIPLGIASRDFDDSTAKVIEGISKIVAAICLLQLSLKLPKWLGVYTSKKHGSEGSTSSSQDFTLRSIRFNVAWNIWREVAECGVFLIPFFLTGEGIKAIPLSAVVGSLVGFLIGMGVYYANKKLTEKRWLALFMSLLLLVMSTGLFTGGAHNLEVVYGETTEVWSLSGKFWSTDRLPMTVLKPFGYSSSRTVLQIVCFWGWLLLGSLLHLRKFRMSRICRENEEKGRSTAQCSFDERDGDSDLESPSSQKSFDDTIEDDTTPETSDVESGTYTPQQSLECSEYESS